MSEDILGLLFIIAVVFVSAIIWHKIVVDYWHANIGSTITAVVIIHVGDYLVLGYLNPFFEVSIITSGTVAAFVSAGIGSLLKKHKLNNEKT